MHDHVVCEVRVNHHHVAVADGGGNIAGSAVDADTFTKNVVVANNGPSPFCRRVEFVILRLKTNISVGVESVVFADGEGAFEEDIGDEGAVGSDSDVAFDDAEWADGCGGVDVGFGVDDCGWMDLWHGGSSLNDVSSI